MNDQLTVKVTADKQAALIEFQSVALTTPATLTLSSDQLLELIQSLGKARAHLEHGKPIPVLENQTIHTIVDTRWYAQPEPLHGGSALMFSHPGFGPVGFLLPKEQVRELVRLLTIQLGATQEGSGQRN